MRQGSEFRVYVVRGLEFRLQPVRGLEFLSIRLELRARPPDRLKAELQTLNRTATDGADSQTGLSS